MTFIGKTGNRVKEERLCLCWTLGKAVHIVRDPVERTMTWEAEKSAGTLP